MAKNVAPAPGKKAPWLSRKWWSALIPLVVMLLNHFLGWDLDPAVIAGLVIPFVAFIFGEAWIDAKK